MRSLGLRADQHDLVAELHVVVDDARELIHRDRRGDEAPPAAHEHLGAPAREPRIAVGVADRHVGDAQRAVGDQPAPVAGRLPGARSRSPATRLVQRNAGVSPWRAGSSPNGDTP